MKSVLFHREAEGDLTSAAAYYEAIRDGFGDDLFEEVERATDRISKRPRSFLVSNDEGYRKCIVIRFPFTLHFAELEEAIWIMAVAHHSRDPDYWKRREPG